MKAFNLLFKTYGDSAVLIEWPAEINEVILDDIRIFSKKIKTCKIKGVVDFNFVYNSLLVNYDNSIISKDKLIISLKKIYLKRNNIVNFQKKTWYIPVCYDMNFGMDLKSFLNEKELKLEEFISMHSSPLYTVYGIGFLPGFLYLGGLPSRLITPRKKIPSLNVLKGSVAIGGDQTGIYPQDSPGGWHVIGKTPIPLFDSNKEIPTFVSAGDRIKFYSISKSEFEIFKIEVATDIYDFKRIVND